MPQKPKPPGWLVLIVMAALLIFTMNIPTFVRIVAPYIGGYMDHVQKEVTKAARSKKPQSNIGQSNSGESDQSEQTDDN